MWFSLSKQEIRDIYEEAFGSRNVCILHQKAAAGMADFETQIRHNGTKRQAILENDG